MNVDRSEKNANDALAASRCAPNASYRPTPKNWSLPAADVVGYAISIVWGVVVYNVASVIVALLS